MPTYEYRCGGCREEFEIFQSIKDKPKRRCPSCGESRLERLISGGGAVLFKGSGFYETDYRSADYKKKAEAEKKAGEPKSDAKTEAKPADKPGKKKAGDKPKAAASGDGRRAKAAGAV